jgi:phage terminase large subunit GpA-like protein
MNAPLEFDTEEQQEWFCDLLDDWTVEVETMTPSEWAESKRYLPPSVTSMPGYFSFKVTPFMREPLDALAIDSPIREVVFMKGVQIAYTTAILENYIGYLIDHVKTAPCMMVTADAELAKLRMESNITPMIQHSELDELIQSDDEGNSRKTGKTDKRVSWQGGGYLVPFGAQNANKLRSLSIRCLLGDEDDAWPLVVGRDGDPHTLVKDRTAAYEQSRKLLNGSTPTIKGLSKIEPMFERGDQRYYFVPCLECGHMQRLRWRRVNKNTGLVSGITWDLDENGKFIFGSARYACEECGHEHTNDDKTRMLDPENGAEWRATATPAAPHIRSYHLSALYSPVGMQSWDACVMKWLEAWDPVNNKVLDTEKLQVFYNNVLGQTFEVKGDKLKFEQVSPHRRNIYEKKQIPNEFAINCMGSRILFTCCVVDVQRDWLAVGVFGFTRGGRSLLIDYEKWEGDCTKSPKMENTIWDRLHEFIANTTYTADDGTRYPIAITAVDSGYLSDHVYTFCEEYESGVIATKGREGEAKNSHMRHFAEMKNMSMGIQAYTISVDAFKDRLQAALKHDWPGGMLQPERSFNAPKDTTDDELKELTVETKRKKINKQTGKLEGYVWHRPSHSRNELWDLLVMAYFIHDLLGFNVCPPDEKNGEYLVNWEEFYDMCESEGLFLAA